jgi:hypothetical protein
LIADSFDDTKIMSSPNPFPMGSMIRDLQTGAEAKVLQVKPSPVVGLLVLVVALEPVVPPEPASQ